MTVNANNGMPDLKHIFRSNIEFKPILFGFHVKLYTMVFYATVWVNRSASKLEYLFVTEHLCNRSQTFFDLPNKNTYVWSFNQLEGVEGRYHMKPKHLNSYRIIHIQSNTSLSGIFANYDCWGTDFIAWTNALQNTQCEQRTQRTKYFL